MTTQHATIRARAQRALSSLGVVCVAALMALVSASCGEESAREDVLIRASRDGTLSTIIMIINGDVDATQAEVNLGGVALDACVEEDTGSTQAPTCVQLSDTRQIAISGVRPGNILVRLESVDMQGAVRLLDLRPETTAIVYLRLEDSGVLTLVSHRRISEGWDDLGDSGQWVAEDVSTP